MFTYSITNLNQGKVLWTFSHLPEDYVLIPWSRVVCFNTLEQGGLF